MKYKLNICKVSNKETVVRTNLHTVFLWLLSVEIDSLTWFEESHLRSD